MTNAPAWRHRGHGKFTQFQTATAIGDAAKNRPGRDAQEWDRRPVLRWRTRWRAMAGAGVFRRRSPVGRGSPVILSRSTEAGGAPDLRFVGTGGGGKINGSSGLGSRAWRLMGRGLNVPEIASCLSAAAAFLSPPSTTDSTPEADGLSAKRHGRGKGGADVALARERSFVLA